MEKSVLIKFDENYLHGDLTMVDNPKGIIVFSHGSGSSRKSPRNCFVANELSKGHFCTLLLDLLTEKEDEDYQKRFDISLLSIRLKKTIEWIKNQKDISKLPIGLFGASTGAASALNVAAIHNDMISAVVSRGGRPDLSYQNLTEVKCPVLLLVGENDPEVINLNKEALTKLNCPKKLVIIPNATHLFEEKGCLEKVANEAKKFFLEHLTKAGN